MPIDHSWTANGALMKDPRILQDINSGILEPSDAIIPAETSLYRAGHRFRYDRATKQFTPNKPDAVYGSPWWSTYDDFNKVTWASPMDNQAEAARDAFAIHAGWGGDCTLFASIITTTDLSVWYGLGRSVTAPDLDSPQLSVAFASQDILQIYIPGFRESALKWSTWRRVFSVGDSYGNGRGFQGNLPQAIRAVGGTPPNQMKLFD